MKLNEYQEGAISTAVYPERLWYPALGMAGEACEFLDKLFSPHESRAEIAKELGDVLWYVANVAHDAGLTLSEIAGTTKFETLQGCPDCEWINIELIRGMGPVMEMAKKTFRDDDGVVTDARREVIRHGLKKVLNALAEYAMECGTCLEEVAKGNLAKLKSRQERGVLKGSGDNR